MPVPGVDFLNGAVDAVVTALKASAVFMSASAASPPAGASGTIVKVEDYLPETTEIPVQYLPHAGVVYLSDDFMAEESSAGDSEIAIDIGIRLYGRSTDRRTLWRNLLQAAAAIERVVALEMNGTGGMFGDFASNALYQGGTAIDTQEAAGYGAMQLVRIQLWATRSDY